MLTFIYFLKFLATEKNQLFASEINTKSGFISLSLKMHVSMKILAC